MRKLLVLLIPILLFSLNPGGYAQSAGSAGAISDNKFENLNLPDENTTSITVLDQKKSDTPK